MAKDNGKIRKLGIPTVVDKVVQLAMTKILKAIYESIFLDVSSGYRPGKDAHDCLKAINHMIMQKKVNWIIDADIKGFFDNIDHSWMIKCLEQRIKDPNFKSLILRFLKAGIMNENIKEETERGTPQGGIISPILANIYLHYILDLWLERQEKKKMTGYTQLTRYADDFIVGVQHQAEAKQILAALAERLKKFGLELSLEKTKIIEFGRFAKENKTKKGKRKPEAFNFLGFTHYCSTTQDGRFMVKVETSSKKLDKAIMGMKIWLKSIRNQKQLKEIWPVLKVKLQGHYNYYGVSGNLEGLKQYYEQTRRLLFKWTNRRSQKKSWDWKTFEKHLLLYPIPKPKLTHAIYHTW